MLCRNNYISWDLYVVLNARPKHSINHKQLFSIRLHIRSFYCPRLKSKFQTSIKQLFSIRRHVRPSYCPGEGPNAGAVSCSSSCFHLGCIIFVLWQAVVYSFYINSKYFSISLCFHYGSLMAHTPCKPKPMVRVSSFTPSVFCTIEHNRKWDWVLYISYYYYYLFYLFYFYFYFIFFIIIYFFYCFFFVFFLQGPAGPQGERGPEGENGESVYWTK